MQWSPMLGKWLTVCKQTDGKSHAEQKQRRWWLGASSSSRPLLDLWRYADVGHGLPCFCAFLSLRSLLLPVMATFSPKHQLYLPSFLLLSHPTVAILKCDLPVSLAPSIPAELGSVALLSLVLLSLGIHPRGTPPWHTGGLGRIPEGGSRRQFLCTLLLLLPLHNSMWEMGDQPRVYRCGCFARL